MEKWEKYLALRSYSIYHFSIFRIIEISVTLKYLEVSKLQSVK